MVEASPDFNISNELVRILDDSVTSQVAKFLDVGKVQSIRVTTAQ